MSVDTLTSSHFELWRRLSRMYGGYMRALLSFIGPKELIVLEGSAHAQFIFATDQGERLMREILRFLSTP